MPDYMRKWLYDRIVRAAKRGGRFHPVVSAYGGDGVWVRDLGVVEFQADTWGAATWRVLGEMVARFDAP